eukprot:gene8424-1505_t
MATPTLSSAGLTGKCTEYDVVGPPWPLVCPASAHTRAEDGGCPSKVTVPYSVDGHPNAGGVKVYYRPETQELSHNKQFDEKQAVLQYYDFQADTQQEEAEAQVQKAVEAAIPNGPPGKVDADE